MYLFIIYYSFISLLFNHSFLINQHSFVHSPTSARRQYALTRLGGTHQSLHRMTSEFRELRVFERIDWKWEWKCYFYHNGMDEFFIAFFDFVRFTWMSFSCKVILTTMDSNLTYFNNRHSFRLIASPCFIYIFIDLLF